MWIGKDNSESLFSHACIFVVLFSTTIHLMSLLLPEVDGGGARWAGIRDGVMTASEF